MMKINIHKNNDENLITRIRKIDDKKIMQNDLLN